MRESIRTVILFMLLGLAIGFIFWIRTQGEETLQGTDQSGQVETTQLEQNVQTFEGESPEQLPDQQDLDSTDPILTEGLQ